MGRLRGDSGPNANSSASRLLKVAVYVVFGRSPLTLQLMPYVLARMARPTAPFSSSWPLASSNILFSSESPS